MVFLCIVPLYSSGASPKQSSPHKRCPERPFALSLLLECARVIRVQLIENRVRRRFGVAKGNRPAIVRQTELGEIGDRPIPDWQKIKNVATTVVLSPCSSVCTLASGSTRPPINRSEASSPRNGFRQLLAGNQEWGRELSGDRSAARRRGPARSSTSIPPHRGRTRG